MSNTPDYLQVTVTLVNKRDIDTFYTILGAWDMGRLYQCLDWGNYEDIETPEDLTFSPLAPEFWTEEPENGRLNLPKSN